MSLGGTRRGRRRLLRRQGIWPVSDRYHVCSRHWVRLAPSRRSSSACFALAAVILVGRFVLHIAWKLVLVALVVVGVLWLLGMAGAPLTVAV